jgi:tight adherence protein B
VDTSFILFIVLAFLAVVMAVEGLYNLWASKNSGEAKRLAARLAAARGEISAEVTLERIRERQRLPAFQEAISQFGWGARLVRHVRASGMSTSPGELILTSVGLFGAGLAAPMLVGRPWILGLALGAALAVLPWWVVASRRNKRVARFENQFPEALDLMSRAMRAGHAFPTAVKMAGEELPEPLGRDFRLLFDEMNYGVPAADALKNLAERVPLTDVSYFVIAVLIQRESGGNLAELLDKIASIVRERLKLMGEIRTLSAEGRLSAQILVALPFVMAFTINLVNPQFMAILWTDPAGLKLIGVALFMMLLGILWMRKIIRIRV